MITSRLLSVHAFAMCTIACIFAASACSFAHDYDALSAGSADAGKIGEDAEAGGPAPGASVQCAAATCTDPEVCCVNPTMAESAEQCTSTSACANVPVVCDDATDCGDPASGARCCLWKEGDVVNVACLDQTTCEGKNSYALLCDDTPAHPCSSGSCTTTDVLPGFHKCSQ